MSVVVATNPDTSAPWDGGRVWQIAKVVDRRGDAKEPTKLEYKARWAGFTEEEDTWEPVASFTDGLEDVINAYNRTRDDGGVSVKASIEEGDGKSAVQWSHVYGSKNQNAGNFKRSIARGAGAGPPNKRRKTSQPTSRHISPSPDPNKWIRKHVNQFKKTMSSAKPNTGVVDLTDDTPSASAPVPPRVASYKSPPRAKVTLPPTIPGSTRSTKINGTAVPRGKYKAKRFTLEVNPAKYFWLSGDSRAKLAKIDSANPSLLLAIHVLNEYFNKH